MEQDLSQRPPLGLRTFGWRFFLVIFLVCLVGLYGLGRVLLPKDRSLLEIFTKKDKIGEKGPVIDNYFSRCGWEGRPQVKVDQEGSVVLLESVPGANWTQVYCDENSGWLEAEGDFEISFDFLVGRFLKDDESNPHGAFEIYNGQIESGQGDFEKLSLKYNKRENEVRVYLFKGSGGYDELGRFDMPVGGGLRLEFRGVSGSEPEGMTISDKDTGEVFLSVALTKKMFGRGLSFGTMYRVGEGVESLGILDMIISGSVDRRAEE